MKTLNASLICMCLALAGATTAFAADDAMMKKPDAMSNDAMAKKDAVMQDCKDHMAMAKKDTMAKKDDAMMKKDAMCDDMMKKDGMMKKDDAMMKKPDAMAADPMKK